MRNHTNRTRWAVPAAGILAAGAMAAIPALTGCAGVDTASAAEATLERFTSCAALNRYAQSHALELVGPYGLAGGGIAVTGAPELMARDSTVPTVTAPAAASAAKAPGTDFSTTNVQEAGIDEPDIVKTDGDRIYALARNRLYAIDASGPQPRIAGSLTLPQDQAARDMLLAGNRILLMSDGAVTVRPLPSGVPGDVPGAKRAGGAPLTSILPVATGSVLTEIDVTDPAGMRTLQSMQTEARYVSARLSGSTARVVVAAGAPMGVTFTSPAQPGAAAERTALAANSNALARTTADDWLPRFSVTSPAGASAPRPLASCTDMSRPSTFSGLDTLTVLTIDLTRGLEPADTDGVMATGENVYASDRALYIATNRWAPIDPNGNPAGENTTHIHMFETAGTSQTIYRGSGVVPGHLLNQFSMSEYDGRLRVATTDLSRSRVGGDVVVEGGGSSESHVTVLEPSGGKLGRIGQVGGLGKGERIYAVRFVGDRGYVVTFRQTDPLYVVDLSTPSAPRVAGELEIAGYSAYLHPIDDDLLIGIGQDATAQGRTTGLQISLFDVSDPAAPKRLQRGVLPGAGSEAEWDHHAFLWWPKRSLAVVPFNRYDIVTPTLVAPAPAGGDGAAGSSGSAPPGGQDAPAAQQLNGAIAMSVTPDAISEAGRVTHPQDPGSGGGVRRSLVIGDLLYTLSDGGLKATALDGFAERAWLPFD